MLSIQSIIDRIVAALRIDAEGLIRAGVRVAAIWVLAWVALRLIGLAARRIEAAVDDGDDSVVTQREKRGKTISQLLRSVGRVVVVSVAILLTLNVFVDIGPLLAGAGILGLAVSFGAQSLVRDVIAGFFILVENQFVVGDVIEAGGKSGVVEGMTLRVVTLRDLEGAVHVVPNGEIKTVSNRTRGWSRAVVDVAVPYTEDLDRAIDIVRNEAEQLGRDEEWAPLLDGTPEVWGVEALSDTAATIRMVARTQPGSHWGIAREFRLRIRKRLAVEGIGAPIQQRRVEVRLDGAGQRGRGEGRGRGGGLVTLALYNTLTRTVEPFVPLAPGRISLYTCGPTIYNYAHIGNFRTFLFEDLLRRWLEASGHEVFHIMNLTDVDDRTIAAAAQRGVSLREHVDPFARAFEEDREWLRIRPPHAQPRATEYIGPMIRLIEGLLAKGVAYRGEDGSVYFAIAKFPAYGRLSRLDQRELKAGASERVSADEYAKEDARDFVLWKAARPEDEAVGAAWDAPFGRGRPGWHIECSAMALELIGQRWGIDVLDIHAGGVDLIFPHHEDEIAQSCAYTGRDLFARYWVHGEFLNIRGEKMSKRFGNITTARDLREDGIDPKAIRLLMSQTHYRQKLDLTDDGLAAAREASRRLGEFQNRLRERRRDTDAPELGVAADRLDREATTALDDDLNAPRAVAALFTFMNEAHAAMDAGRAPGPRAIATWDRIEGVLGVATQVRQVRVRAPADGVGPQPETPASAPPDTPPADAAAAEAWARRWAEIRAGFKTRRDFAAADRVRELLRRHGFEVRDARDGSIEVTRTGPVVDYT